ncbi:MAG: hypothetical protein DSZ00_05155 [Gammaproteobacteria bacterium]|nr:MAG: hypothetical protein DSZ00_05155 [Gammaproteobacteria bacterium]
MYAVERKRYHASNAFLRLAPMTRRHLLQLMLGLILVIGQGLLLLHQAQHVDAVGGHDCPVCIQAQAFRAEAPTSLPPPLFAPALESIALLLVTVPFIRLADAFQPRAPPLLTRPSPITA